MKNSKMNFLFFISFFIIFSCSLDSDSIFNRYKPGNYIMIEVPVPQEGITFPIGNDNDTATINNAYFIGETQVTFKLWQAVSYWATFEKKGEKYCYIYWESHPYQNDNHINYPICGVTYIQTLIWCNAYTEWYNEKYGTNYTTVYNEKSGQPIRSARDPWGPNAVMLQDYDLYFNYFPAMENYLNNIETTGTGFRLPSINEWELAARWRGNDNTNSVTETINNINFTKYPFKFTKGNSVSGANDYFANWQECDKYAVFYENSNSRLSLPKTKMPNALNIYDMCGNLREYVYKVVYQKLDLGGGNLVDVYLAYTKGGYYDDYYESISIGRAWLVNVALYNYYYGFRIARDK